MHYFCMIVDHDTCPKNEILLLRIVIIILNQICTEYKNKNTGYIDTFLLSPKSNYIKSTVN